MSHSILDIIPLDIPEVNLIKLIKREDSRGIFMETFREEDFYPLKFVQDSHSGSRRGVLRGLHYQIEPASQCKLVRVLVGKIFDVVVDLRKSSATFGQWVGVNLYADRGELLIPVGFAHGFYVLSDWAEVLYKSTNYYSPACERTLFWNDPRINISWPLIDEKRPILSDKDYQGKLLSEADLFD